MYPCASAASAATLKPTTYVAGFNSVSGTTLASRGARAGDLILSNGQPTFTSGGSWVSAGGGIYYRKLTTADASGSLGSGYLCMVFRGALATAAVVSSGGGGGTLGQGGASGFTRNARHAGIAIIGNIYTNYTPAFSAPAGIVSRLTLWNGTDTTDYAMSRLAPPSALYASGAAFACSWAVEDDAAGVPGNSQNHGGTFAVIELRS